VFERYALGADENCCSPMVAKSIISTLVGFAIGDGLIDRSAIRSTILPN
jgi:hypothetical protein